MSTTPAPQRRIGLTVEAVTLAAALAVAAVMWLAIVGKFTKPDPAIWAWKPGRVDFTERGLLMDHAIAMSEVFILTAFLLGWRLRVAWLCVAVMFGGLTGVVAHSLTLGRECGCFGGLVKIPPQASIAMDVGFALLALLVAWLRGTPRAALIAALALGVAGGFGGWQFSKWKNPPSVSQVETVYAGKKAIDRLLETPLMEEVRLSAVIGPSYFVFVYDEHCPICQQRLPIVENARTALESAHDGTLRVKIVSKQRAEAELGIEAYAWTNSPMVFLVHAGKLIKEWGGAGSPLPDDVQMQLMTEQIKVPRS
ncbi:MAG: hypothetical protein IBJ11_03830 [Phycisphaerales bacterium]|nr:hypothetical protein [Phycisphaerales bacterium]